MTTATATPLPCDTELLALTETREVHGTVTHALNPCSRCDGSGHYSFNPVDGTRCFQCQGSRGTWVEVGEYLRLARNRAKARAARARKAAREAAEREARIPRLHAELTEAHPLLAELTYLGNVNYDDARGAVNYGGILGELRGKLENYGSLSDKQIALAEKIIREDMDREARRAERAAARTNAAIGEIGERRDFTGTVRWFDHYTDFYGYSETTSTVMIIDTAEGTVKWKASKYIELERGQQVTIKATVKEHSIYDKTEEIATVVTRGKLL
ncbi:MAG TPA: zf-TFIIB domain-containing protein [Propionibacteriaceae bacterium]|jgi:hypothetical protein|nr:zf-TFIIB domain-containing protein [Propionibacteriaceae bacterium]